MLFSFKKHTEKKLQEKKVKIKKEDRSNDKIIFGKVVNPLVKLKELVTRSHNVLLTLTSIYPFDLFPDTITIDENKVNIIKKELFGAENVHSILIEDITNVTVSTGIMTATLEIVDSTNVRFPTTYTIHHLHIRQARLARRLIQGLISCKREGVDLSSCDNAAIVESLEELGFAKGENSKN